MGSFGPIVHIPSSTYAITGGWFSPGSSGGGYSSSGSSIGSWDSGSPYKRTIFDWTIPLPNVDGDGPGLIMFAMFATILMAIIGIICS